MHRKTFLSVVAGSCLALSAVAQDYTVSAGATYRRLGRLTSRAGGLPIPPWQVPRTSTAPPPAALPGPGGLSSNLSCRWWAPGVFGQLAAAGGDDEFGRRAGVTLSLGRTLASSAPGRWPGT